MLENVPLWVLITYVVGMPIAWTIAGAMIMESSTAKMFPREELMMAGMMGLIVALAWPLILAGILATMLSIGIGWAGGKLLGLAMNKWLKLLRIRT